MEPQYTFTAEEPVKKEMLSAEDEKKFGFTENVIQPKGK
jgi:hypothetical protein